MKEEKTRNISDLNDGLNNLPESDNMIERSVSQNKEKQLLNYGDIVIMIWRRIKMNENMLERIK